MPIVGPRASRDRALSAAQVQGLLRREEESHPRLREAAGCASGLHHLLRGKLSPLGAGQARVQVKAVPPTGSKWGILRNRIYFMGPL